MALELEINAATRAFLPEGAMEFATPVKRVRIEHPEFDEPIFIVGRLVPQIMNSVLNEQTYVLIFRLESSEIDTNFIAIRTFKRNVDSPFCSFEEAKNMVWTDKFKTLLDGRYRRLWLTPDLKQPLQIFFQGNGIGIIRRLDGHATSINFRWRQDSKDTLLSLTNQQFEELAANLYSDQENNLSFALRWIDLPLLEKDEIAFACAYGTWSDLRQIARWVLQLYTGQESSFPENEFIWYLTRSSLEWGDESSTESGQHLREWREALIKHFQPLYALGTAYGDYQHICLRKHVFQSKLLRIKITKPSHHEILEAQFQLSNWASENLPSVEAKRLLDV